MKVSYQNGFVFCRKLGRKIVEKAGQRRNEWRFPMKILITSDTWAPAVNGVVRSTQLLYQQLKQMGHEVRVVTLAANGESFRRGDVIFLGSISAGKIYPGARIGICSGGEYLRELEAWRPDVIHAQSEFTTFSVARRLAKRCGCPLVHTYHTVYEDYTHYLHLSPKLGRGIVASFTRQIEKRCDLLLAPSPKIETLLHGYGVVCPVQVVPTGVDLNTFHPARDGGTWRRAVREALGILPEERVLLSVGRVAEEKQPEALLELLAGLPQEKRPHLVFVGDGPSRPALEVRAEQLGLKLWVHFVGMVPPQEAPQWYQVGDVFVSASQSETQGLTYYEALACGLPLLCRKDACLNGVVAEGRNGWQWTNAEEFAAALAELDNDPTRLFWLTKGALETACRYSAERFAQQVLDAYAWAIQSHSVGRTVFPWGQNPAEELRLS